MLERLEHRWGCDGAACYRSDCCFCCSSSSVSRCPLIDVLGGKELAGNAHCAARLVPLEVPAARTLEVVMRAVVSAQNICLLEPLMRECRGGRRT